MRVPRHFALALCLALGLSVVQRGLFHRCVHAIHQDQATSSAATVKGDCPVCDVMLPVCDGAGTPEMTRHTDMVAVVGTPPMLAERFGHCSRLPGRGPPCLMV